MADLLEFKKVSLFKNETYGIADVSFILERGRKYHLWVSEEEKLNTLAGLIEGRFQKESGFIGRAKRLFIQSDRLLLGEKNHLRSARQYLALGDDLFEFGGRKRSKYGFIQLLKAKHILDYPIYRLKGEDKIKFTLLALSFQESGLTLISRLLQMDLKEDLQAFLVRIIKESHTSCCLLSNRESAARPWNFAEFDLITHEIV